MLIDRKIFLLSVAKLAQLLLLFENSTGEICREQDANLLRIRSRERKEGEGRHTHFQTQALQLPTTKTLCHRLLGKPFA